jgi:hypothetical protein
MGFDLYAFYNDATAGAVITPSSVTSLNETNINADLQAYAANLSAWVNANIPNATVGDVVGCRKIIPLNAAGNYFPISLSTPQYEFSDLPWTWVHWANFQMYQGFNYVISLPELYGQSLTLTAVPATPPIRRSLTNTAAFSMCPRPISSL